MQQPNKQCSWSCQRISIGWKALCKWIQAPMLQRNCTWHCNNCTLQCVAHVCCTRVYTKATHMSERSRVPWRVIYFQIPLAVLIMMMISSRSSRQQERRSNRPWRLLSHSGSTRSMPPPSSSPNLAYCPLSLPSSSSSLSSSLGGVPMALCHQRCLPSSSSSLSSICLPFITSSLLPSLTCTVLGI